MTLTYATAKELVHKIATEASTLRGDDGGFSLRIVEHGPWTLIITTVNTMTLFENKLICFSIQVKDTAHDVSDLLVKAYDHEIDDSLFEVL
jgi:hypothetical protein